MRRIDVRWPGQLMRYQKRVLVADSQECWRWTGGYMDNGYGTMTVRDFDGTKYRTTAHRFAYVLAYGQVPEGMHVDHRCRNRGCVNPAHLRPLTPQENGSWTNPHGVKTHCPKGHPYSGDNLYVRIDGGGRMCKTCNRDKKRIEYQTKGDPRKRKREAA